MPEYIRMVERMVNTIVEDRGKDVPFRYADRWKLEMVFRRNKSDECLDKIRGEGDFTLIGIEFLNFISTLITCRIVERMKKTELLKEMTYQELMEDLTATWRLTNAPEQAHSDDRYWAHVK